MTEKPVVPEEPEVLEKRNYLKPVAWLGGRDFLANLKYFLLFAAFKGKLDPRDWMQAQTFPPKTHEREEKYFDTFIKPKPEGQDEFWFDYFADSGDGMTAGYAIAYLCMSDLHAKLPPDWDKLSSEEKRSQLDAGAPLAEIRSHLAADHSQSTIAKDYSPQTLRGILDQWKQNKNADEIIASIEQETVGVVSVSTSEKPAPPDCLTLPRGAFLFVGGDTSYHVADYAGLGLRFQKVFDWAFDDLGKPLPPGKERQAKLREMWSEPNRRPVLAVPGNHDYYDMIDGFNRQFARSLTREISFINLSGRNLPPQLRLWPFKRFQTASYVAIKLPFGWWFWGVDSELKRVDIRQQEYFKRSYALSLEDKSLEKLKLEEEIDQYLEAERGRPPTPEERDRRFPRLKQTDFGSVWKFPKKLIVATSEPTTVEGRRAREDEKTPQAFSFLGLKRPFLYLEDSRKPKSEAARKQQCEKAQKILEHEEALELPHFDCRLDISGDVHHYARYWGDDSLGESSGAATADNYASVVSGGGGASMSPTQTDYDEVEEQALYPRKEVSKRIINKGLFNPWVVISGGNVYVAGAVVAMILVFGASYSSSHVAFTNLILETLRYAAPAISPGPLPSPGQIGQVLRLSFLLLLAMLAIIGAGGYIGWLFERLRKTYEWGRNKQLNLHLAERTDEGKKKLYVDLLGDIEAQRNAGVPAEKLLGFWVVSAMGFLATGLLWALELMADSPFFQSRLTYGLLFSLLVLVAVGAIGIVCRHSKKRVDELNGLVTSFERSDKDQKESDAAQVKRVREFTVTPFHDYLPFWALLIAGLGNFFLVIWEFKTTARFPLFGKSTLILFSIFVAGAAAVVSMYYSKWLFEQSYSVKVTWYSYIPATTLTVSAIGVCGSAIWFFANQQARFIIADNLFLLVLLAVPIGCLVLALYVGNHVATWKLRIIFFVMGAWHGFLQLVVPFLLIWVGGGRALLAALTTVVLVALISTTVVTQLRLEHLKFVINRGLLPILWLIYGAWMVAVPFIWPEPLPDPTINPGRLSLVGACALAGVIGALMSCVWLGWYFAVALVFDGHANEAGSTARTEEYKQFIRFRITKDTLTGFVIGVDFPHAPQDRKTLVKDGSTLKPRLIDVFTLRCPPGET